MWLVLALVALMFFGLEDNFLRMGTDVEDEFSQYRITVISGFCYLFLDVIAHIYSETHYTFSYAFSQWPVLFLVPFLYAAASFFCVIGFRYLEASIMGPLQNIGAAFATPLFLFWFFILGEIDNVSEYVNGWDVIATVLILTGVITLSFLEWSYSKKGGSESRGNKLGVVAFIFPIMYCLVDVFDTVFSGLALNAGEDSVGPFDYFRLYAFARFVTATVAWLMLCYKAKTFYNPFSRTYWAYWIACLLDTGGILINLIAMSINPIFVALIITPSSIITEAFAYFVQKERFTKKQYLCFALIIFGICLAGYGEFLRG